MGIRYKFSNWIEHIWYRHIKDYLYWGKSKQKLQKRRAKSKINNSINRSYDWREDEVRTLGGSKTHYIRLPDETAKQEYFSYLVDKQKDWKYNYKRGQVDSYYKSEYQRYMSKCPICGHSVWGGGEHKYFKNKDGVFQHCYCDIPAVESKEEAIRRGFMDKDGNLLDDSGKVIGHIKQNTNQ